MLTKHTECGRIDMFTDRVNTVSILAYLTIGVFLKLLLWTLSVNKIDCSATGAFCVLSLADERGC